MKQGNQIIKSKFSFVFFKN